MGKRIDLTGQMFGKLTVECYSHTDKYGIKWKCHCDCGNIVSVSTGSLRSGNSTSCGHKRKDIAGQRFGNLIAESYLYCRKKDAIWQCICDCGKTTQVTGSNLRRGHTKSCGCTNKMLQIKNYFLGKQNYYKESECGTYIEGYLLQKHYVKYDNILSMFECDEVEIEKIEDSIESLIKVALLGKPDFIFDKSMYEEIKKHIWRRHGNNIVAIVSKKHVSLNRYLLGCFMSINNKNATFKDDKYFDYRFSNIKLSDNTLIRHKSNINNKTGYRGVKFQPLKKSQYKFYAQIWINGKSTHIGKFKTAKEAAKAYNKKALELYGKYAYQNDVK